jgi:rubrerythrin
MDEETITASSIITFTQKTEDSTSEFYTLMAEKFPANKEMFLNFVKEGKKNKTLITRTYQETISDALEACFSFNNLDLNTYAIDIILNEDTSYSEALKKAIENEEKVISFYLIVAEQSKDLLATIPRAFKKVAEKRNNRKNKLLEKLKLI